MRLEYNEPLAMLPDAATQLLADIRAGREFGKAPKPYLCSASGERIDYAADQQIDQPGMIAVVPLSGTLDPDGSWGGTSLTDFTRTIKRLGASANIAHIVLAVRSPGGTVTGTPEATDAVRALRGVKPTTAVIDGMMASGATWIGTAADRVVISPSGQVGSIGVYTMYADMSRMLKEAGIDVTVVRAPEMKNRFTGVEPMTEEMLAITKARVDGYYEEFKKAMAKNRGVSVSQVESRFGGGEMLLAKQALEAGLVDEIATFDEALSKIVAKHTRRAPATARAKLSLAMLDT